MLRDASDNGSGTGGSDETIARGRKCNGHHRPDAHSLLIFLWLIEEVETQGAVVTVSGRQDFPIGAPGEVPQPVGHLRKGMDDVAASRIDDRQ